MQDKADLTYVNQQLQQKVTSGYVDQKVTDGIALLVDSAPAALDTLKELAQALDNDSSYAATIETQLGHKADKSTTYTKVETNGLLSDKRQSQP